MMCTLLNKICSKVYTKLSEKSSISRLSYVSKRISTEKGLLSLQTLLKYGHNVMNGVKIPMNYTLENCQKLVDDWIHSVGVRYFSELTNTAILMEEVGELARIMARQYGDQSFKENEQDIDLEEEMADILFVLLCLANQTGVELEEAFKKSIQKKTRRDKERHSQNPKLLENRGDGQ